MPRVFKTTVPFTNIAVRSCKLNLFYQRCTYKMLSESNSFETKK